MPKKKKSRWTLEKVKRRGVKKYTQDPNNSNRKIINPVWRKLAIVYSPECAEEIITRVREGEPITKICGQKGMPSYPTVCSWIRKVEGFGDDLRRAKSDAQLLIHDRMDDDFVKMHTDIEDKDPKIANAKATLYREQVGWRKWSMERLNPETFSPKMQIDQNVNIKQVSFIIETSKPQNQVIDIVKRVEVGGELKKEEIEEELP